MTRSKSRIYTKRRRLRKRRGTKRHNRRQSIKRSIKRNKRQYGGFIEMTTSDNPNGMNDEEYQLARQMRIIT